MNTFLNWTLAAIGGWWAGAAVAVVQMGGLPHIHIMIEWTV